MRSQGHGTVTLLAVILLGMPLARAADAPPGRVPEPRTAIRALTPDVPGEVVAAMQEGRFVEAVAALDRLAADPKANADDKAYLALVRGVALRLAGKLDDARTGLRAALDANPKGPWAAKLRSELAATELAAGRFAEAEALARAEAETLLAGERKDRLAEVYRDFANRLLKPESPVVPPDPEGAYALLAQARGLAKGTDLRARLLFEMARASQAANNHPRAIENFLAYPKEFPQGPDRFAARFHLGESQVAIGQSYQQARPTWEDLARDLEKVDAKDAQDFRARALYAVATTYAVPEPPNDLNLYLGVAALKRFLTAYPTHPLAVRAAFQIGQSFMARAKSQEALEAFTAFLKTETRAETDEARRERADLAMSAAFRIGQILQGQEKFDDAIAAFKGYLAQYPNGPQSADAQRAILDTQLLIAGDRLRRKQYDQARAAWTAFAAANPLDARVPQLLFRIGESHVAQEKFDDAIAAWETLVGKFPGSEPAAHAQFLIASIFENQKGNPSEAIERFRKVAADPWKSQAAQRIAVMEAKALTVATPRIFRTGETPHLKIATRNLEKLTFTAYRLDTEAYFRKKQALEDVEALDIGLVAPDVEWTVEVPRYGKYRPIDTTYDLDKKVTIPGVYVVKVSDEKTLQATTLVLGSDVDAIVKVSRDQLLVFAQDMKTGAGRPNARVLISDGENVILEAVTGKDGVLLKDWDKPRDPNAALDFLVLDGDHIAGSGLGVPERVAQGLTARAYLYTDRPAYRPGQQVELRGVVREVESGRYANRPRAVYRLDVSDSRGRLFLSKTVTLSEFGAFHDRIPLDSGAPVGTYRVRLHQPGKSDFAGQFEVQAYQLQKTDLAFDLPRTIYYRGETIAGSLVARYQYGTPLADRPIEVQLPDGRILRGRTDAAGKFPFEFKTEGWSQEQAMRLSAQLPEDNVAANALVMLAVRAFGIRPSTPRDVLLDGETFPLRVVTFDAQGEPTGQTLSVAVLKVVEQDGRTAEREVVRLEVKTDPKTGEGSVPIKVEDERGGSYILRVAGTDRFGNPVVADRAVTVSGKADETKLRLLADRLEYKVGEEAKVTLHNRSGSGVALLAWEADRILNYKLVPLKDGANEVAWEVVGDQFPNFTLTAARMAGNRFHEARLDLGVERDLRVTLKPTKPTVGPGDEVEVEVTTADQLGRPVSAEVSLALVDRALLRQFRDSQPPIGPFFHQQTRTSAFAVTATNTFDYAPATAGVAEAVVEEVEQAKARLGDEVARKNARRMVDAPMGGTGLGGVTANFTESDMKALAARLSREKKTGSGQYQALSTRRSGTPADALEVGRGTVADLAEAAAAGEAGEGLPFIQGTASGAQSMLPGFNPSSGKPNRYYDLAASDVSDLNEEQVQLWNKQAANNFRFGTMRGRGLQVQVRQQFIETAYWNPSVVTGKDGKARVTFKAPPALSEYRFTARGVTGADTLVGQTTADLAVRKTFFADLKLPAALTEGDKPRLSARLHHTGAVGRAEIRLTVYAGDREQVFPRTIELKGDGVEEIAFDPFTVPDGDAVRLTLSARVGETSDELTAEVPIRPWGVQAFASASGTATDDATVFVGLPAGRKYESPEMLVVFSPTVRRMLIELALGDEANLLDRRMRTCLLPVAPNTTSDRAGDLLAAVSALTYLQAVRAGDAPEAGRLTDRVRGLLAELVQLQNEDGGWPWVAGGDPTTQRPSDRLTTARVLFALAGTAPLGLRTDPAVADKAVAYLTAEFAKVDGSDHETRATILHALSTRGRATFEQANGLNRVRQSLSDVSLAYLALTLANLDRASLANEVLDVLAPRAKSEDVAPGLPPRRYWSGSGQSPWHGSAVETTALAALAFARTRPEARETVGAIDWLTAHRLGTGWQPHKAQGPALAALALFHGRARAAEDRYTLTVIVNDQVVGKVEVDGPAEGKAIRVPVRTLAPGGENRVKFDIEGRGQFGYAVVLTGFARDFGPDQDRTNRPFVIARRVYAAADPELDGKTLPVGWNAVLNARPFENVVTQVALGGRARVHLDAWTNIPSERPLWERDFLIVEEHLPAGTTLVEGSVRSNASHYELVDGVLTFYIPPDRYPGGIQYDVNGYLPGEYRVLPPRIRSAYEPGRSHLGPVGSLKVLNAGETSTDSYTPSPDELLARGKALFDAGRLAEAAAPLEALRGGYTLRDEIARDVARMLLAVHIRNYDPRKIVVNFEFLKEKAPDLVIPFDDILVVGRAYRDIGEHERAYLVWRAIAEASYLEDARVGEVLRQRGRTLEGMALWLELWREHPSSASIQADFFGLSQILAGLAGRAVTVPDLRRELASADVARSDLLLQTIRLTQVFLSLAPRDPLADEASLALVGAFLELEDFPKVVGLSARFAKLYPKSRFLDSFQYSEALGRFHLGEYDRAIEVAEVIARATYKDADGVDQPSPNKWEAIYILGQIYDARRRPAQAVDYYTKVADRFTDAADAVKGLTRKGLTLPEVAVIRPEAPPSVAGGVGLRAIAPEPPRDKGAKPLDLEYRNIAEADVKVYPVDLMRLYLTRRNLDEIAGIDLAGIRPLLTTKLKLGDGQDFADKVRTLDLPLRKEGAYLVMVRGDNLHASGIVLVSPIELEVREEADAGRVRVTVRDARTQDLVPRVQVKVIGTDNGTFFSGETDLRGVFVAEGVRGQVTAVARKDAQYAFYRGKTSIGAPPRRPASTAPAGPGGEAKPDAPQALDQNIKGQNRDNQQRQLERLENRYKESGKGVQVDKAY